MHRTHRRTGAAVALALALVATLLGLAGPTVAPAGAAAPTGPARWTAIANGNGHACGVTTGGAAYCWGQESYRLGTGDDLSARSYPTAVVTPAGVRWASISAGTTHTCAVTTTGDGYCWGEDFGGELGDGPHVEGQLYARNASLVAAPPGVTWSSIDAGDNGTCGVTTTGDAYCWGRGVESPTLVAAPAGTTWTMVDVAYQYACGVTSAHELMCWGKDYYDQLGNGPDTLPHPDPVAVSAPAGTEWATVATGWGVTCAATTSGTGYCWGRNDTGQLGNGTTGGTDAPTTPVTAPAGTGWASFTMGGVGTHTCGLTTTGVAYCWGRDLTGERLGNGPDLGDQTTPTPVVGGHTWRQISSGNYANCGTTTDGHGLCWGWMRYGGGLGNGESGPVPAPVEVELTVELLAQEITFPQPAGMTVGDQPATLGATASSNLTVTYTASGPCTIVDGTKVAPTGAGSCTVTASQAGDGSHAAATPVGRSFAIAKAATQTALAADVVVAGVGDEITFEATVTGPGTPQGAVTFTATPDVGAARTSTDDELASDGTARFSPADLPVGTWSVVARFDGSADHRTSTSTALVVRVAGPAEEAVASAYAAVLGREPDPAGLRFWVEQLGTRSPAVVADALAKSREGRARLVTLTYESVLGYRPGTASRDYWVGELLAGRTTAERLVAELYGTIATSPVDALYRIHLGRTPSTADRTYWGPKVDTAPERRQASLGTGRTPEALRVLVRRATTAACGEGAAAPTGAALTAATDLARATAGDIVRVTARLAATHCPTT